MTVLPQLERELIAAHERRAARRWWRRGFGAGRIAQVAAVALGVAVVAIVLGHGHAPHPTAPGGPAAGRTTLLRGLHAPDAYVTTAGMFLSDRVNASESRLMRIDPVSGQITCDITFGGVVDDVTVAAGAVWVTTTSDSRHLLWHLDSKALVRLSPVVRLDSSPASAGPTGSLAVAGGWLWVGTAESIERVALQNGAVTAVVPVARAHGVRLAADSTGRVLLDSVRSQGSRFRSRVQRRDARTGAKLDEVSSGIPPPRIVGIVDGLAWVKVNRPGVGWVTSLDARTLRTTSRTPVAPATSM
jgi:hypothetical protein